MQFHHHGYVSGDPRIQPAAGTGLDRPEDLPDEVDVLVVGAGPAGMMTAAQLSQFPGITTRIVERRAGRLELGQADGIQARSLETFQAFGFAQRLVEEAYRVTEIAYWDPDPEDRSRIVRTSRTIEDPDGFSEFPHVIVNQARVLDYLAEYMAHAPTRMTPDYGWEFRGLEVTGDDDRPVDVVLARTTGPDAGLERTVRARYVVGADGARSGVRRAIGRVLEGDQANHAWGVVDALLETDFPDVRTESVVRSSGGGNILLVPREGGHLTRLYVDLGAVDDGGRDVRGTSTEEIVARANAILHPYRIDVRHVAWQSVYEVGHRIADAFDDAPADGGRGPRVFIAGDACHTHSAKAGQGMNVSLQDGFNLGWKLGHVLEGRSPESLLDTYADERRAVAQDLIDFDRTWSSLLAAGAEEVEDPAALEAFYVATAEFPAGFLTRYGPSMITARAPERSAATGFPIGKRFASAPVTRVCDGSVVHLGHTAQADGRWRVYVFADDAGDGSSLPALSDWWERDPDSPLVTGSVEGDDDDARIDLKVVYRGPHTRIDLGAVPAVFLPRVGPFRLLDREKVFAAAPGDDIFARRGVADGGAVVVVRPDQYVAQVLPLDALDDLAAFFRGVGTGASAPTR